MRELKNGRNCEMDLLETAAVCALVLRIRKKKIRRQYWVHPIYSCRLLKGKFYTLYENLREHPIKFFSYYFRMNISTFDDQQLAYLGSDIILCLSLCLGVRTVIYFSRCATVGTHNYRRLSAELKDTCLARDVSDSVRCPVNSIALALKTKLYAGNQSLV